MKNCILYITYVLIGVFSELVFLRYFFSFFNLEIGILDCTVMSVFCTTFCISIGFAVKYVPE